MSRQNVQVHAVNDMIGERNHYWDKASQMAEKLLGADNATEILADFLTKLAYSPSDADPMQVLSTVCWDWDCEVEEEEEDELEFVA
jgi:hypothetical protein